MCDFLHITSEVPERKQCPKCLLNSMVREISAPHTQNKAFHKPVQMHSCAPVDPDEVKALRAKLPSDVEMSIDPNDELYGVPIAVNESQRKAVLKATGYVDLDKPK
jgi:hypothetical protein